MKILTIGDIHGRDNWKNILNKNKDLNKIIFTGDYVDSFTKPNVEILSNLKDIINFKKEYDTDVILLIGNHDCQYLIGYGYPEYGCNGFRPEMLPDLQQLFYENRELFQFSYQLDNYLWTHAGISSKWYKTRFKEVFEDFDTNTLSEALNYTFDNKLECIFDVGYKRGGRKPTGGPLWADMYELIHNGMPLKDYNQIVGHNPVKYIRQERFGVNRSIVFTDCLEYNDTGYILNI